MTQVRLLTLVDIVVGECGGWEQEGGQVEGGVCGPCVQKVQLSLELASSWAFVFFVSFC